MQHADLRVRRGLKLRDLDTLVAVSQYGSMAKAAAHLSVSQPAISKAIAEMEHTLGVRLLDRTAHGVEPNLYGRTLLKWANIVFDDVSQGINELKFLADPTKGELRISATEPTVAGLLPAALELLHSRYPAICIHIRQAASARERSRELRERNFDLAIGGVVEPVDDDIDAQVLFYDPTFVVAGLKSRWSHRRKISLAELTDEPWILPPPDSVLGSLIVDAFRKNGLAVPAANVVTLAIQLYSTLSANGPYLAICPGSVLHFSATRLALKALPVDLGVPPWPIAITTLKNRTISPVAQLFIQCVRDAAKPLAKARWNRK
jgi:DNA-binding transcriptional LysR family regulator